MDSCIGCNKPIKNEILCIECKINSTNHKQVNSEFGELIDEELVDIINMFHKVGIHTNNSCQSQTNTKYINKTWICFNSLKDIQKLFQICRYDYAFYDYITDKEWEIIVDPMYILDTSMYEYSLRFPYEDLQYFKNSFYACMNH